MNLLCGHISEKLSAVSQLAFEKSDDAKDINFMIIHKPAVMQITKHQAPKVIMPEANPDADAYKFGYRIYGLNRVFENKKNGIYLSAKA